MKWPSWWVLINTRAKLQMKREKREGENCNPPLIPKPFTCIKPNNMNGFLFIFFSFLPHSLGQSLKKKMKTSDTSLLLVWHQRWPQPPRFMSNSTCFPNQWSRLCCCHWACTWSHLPLFRSPLDQWTLTCWMLPETTVSHLFSFLFNWQSEKKLISSFFIDCSSTLTKRSWSQRDF